MKTITAAVVSTVVATTLAGCTHVRVLDGMNVHCPNNPSAKITAREGKLVLNNKEIKVCRAESVRLTFKNPVPAANTARTMAKNDDDDDWLNKTFNGEEIKIDVPGDIPPTRGESPGYGYIIEVDGVGRLDPRFVVQ